ncbi:unnamed protein product, partial [Rotaria sordida]
MDSEFIPNEHIDVVGTLINLATIDCSRQNFKQTLIKYQQPKQKFIILLNYRMVLEEYEVALKLQEGSLPH